MTYSLCFYVFFFKQKTAYEIKECDWSSDVCSSDLNVSLVIIDNQIPCCEGSRIINSYARREGFVGVPFVLLYGGSEEIGEQAVKDGAFGYVLKSGINMVDDLIETTRKALNQ